MTGWRMILATMALVVFVSTSRGAVQRFEKPHSHASSTCSAPEVKQPHADTNRVALVIGNFNYPDADTPPAQTGNDACALASALRKDGFDVDLVQNATRNDMQRAIERLEAKVRHDSIIMIYFGGYGVQSGGQNYLIPVDAKIWDEQDVRHVGVCADWLFAGLKSSGAHVRLAAVIDASRRNPYERRFRSYSHGLAPIQADENALILTSEPPGAVADDSDGSHSPLITALLHEMSSSTRSVEEIFERTRLVVALTTQNQQHPTVSSSLIDDVKLGPAPANATVSSGQNTSLDRRG